MAGAPVSLSSRLRTHTVTVRAYEGATPTGADLAAPVDVSCRVEDVRKLVPDSAGVEVLSSARIFCDLDVTIPPESEVDIDGRTTRVLTVEIFDTGGRSSLDHLEVMVQ